MQRNPIDQFLKDPDNKAKLFIWLTRSMIIVTFMITIGTIIFILYLLGVINYLIYSLARLFYFFI